MITPSAALHADKYSNRCQTPPPKHEFGRFLLLLDVCVFSGKVQDIPDSVWEITEGPLCSSKVPMWAQRSGFRDPPSPYKAVASAAAASNCRRPPAAKQQEAAGNAPKVSASAPRAPFGFPHTTSSIFYL